MKTMTCAQLGGPCDAKIQGATAEEMMQNGMMHLEAMHPDMAADVKAMPKEDPKIVEWSNKFMADFAAAPEDNA